jgi:hypothetical protein
MRYQCGGLFDVGPEQEARRLVSISGFVRTAMAAALVTARAELGLFGECGAEHGGFSATYIDVLPESY